MSDNAHYSTAVIATLSTDVVAETRGYGTTFTSFLRLPLGTFLPELSIVQHRSEIRSR